MLLKQIFLTPTCLHCHSWRCTEALFCETCFEEQINLRLLKTCLHSETENYRHIYLFDWHRSESETLDQFVYRLKSNNSVQALKVYSQILAFKIKSQIDLNQVKAIIPIPSARISSVHASLLAQFLSRDFKLPIWPIFQKQAGPVQQKYLNAKKRKEQSLFTLDEHQYEEFTRQDPKSAVYSKSQDQTFLFVDDVLTTGQSFLQCAELLRRHNSVLGISIKQNIIATLFYRPSLKL